MGSSRVFRSAGVKLKRVTVLCCFAFRKLAVFDTWSKVVVHVAMDNTVVIEEISECSCVATWCFFH